MRRRFWSCLALFALVLLTGSTAHRYVEDFTTTQYRDPLGTTAWWDTTSGSLRLFPFQMSLVGGYDTPGQAFGVAIEGDLAFVADGFDLQILDITDPANPLFVSAAPLPGASDVVVSGDYAYVAAFDSGFQVVDIEDPTTPVVVATLPTPDAANRLALDGNHVFVADRFSGLQVIDVGDPTIPAIVGSVDTPDFAYDVAVAGDHAYVPDYYGGFHVIDISDPSNPFIAGSYTDVGFHFGVDVAGDYAYVTSNSLGLHIIDITDPANPTLAGGYNTTGTSWDVEVDGDYAYVADHDTGLQVIGVSDPANPVLVQAVDTPGSATGVALAGVHAFVADRSGGLQAIEVLRRVDPPFQPANLATTGQAFTIAVAGDHAFVGDLNTGFFIFDVSNPGRPQEVTSIPGAVIDLEIAGDHAYLAGSAIDVVDISDPTMPAIVGNFTTGATASDIEVDGNYLYGGYGFVGLQVIDISDPQNPALAGAYANGNSLSNVTVFGDYVFVNDTSAGTVLTIDVSNPTNPSLAGSYTPASSPKKATVAGNSMFLAVGIAGVEVIDITDPTTPTFAGILDTPGIAISIALAGDIGFVADNANGVQILNISDPTNPAILDSYDTPGLANMVWVEREIAYVADRAEGVQVLVAFDGLTTAGKAGQSTPIDLVTDNMIKVKLSSSQRDSIHWELSFDNGLNWEHFLPGDPHKVAAFPGSDFMWRSTHYYLGGAENPSVSLLDVDWLYDIAAVDSIVDVPDDQGGWLRVYFTRSAFDFVGESLPIASYKIFRRDTSGVWEVINTVFAQQQDQYIAVVPALADNTPTAYYISAQTTNPGVFYDSPADSGVSIDNIVPGVPQTFTVSYNAPGGNDLSWTPPQDPDVAGFRIYRGETPGFPVTPDNLVHTTSATSWTDADEPAWQYHYRLTAVDDAGNESEPANPGTVTGTPNDVPPRAMRLYQNTPNPFNPSTVIRYDVPRGGVPMTIEIFDVSGRLVRRLVDGAQTAGRKTVSWNGRDGRGRRVASGVYFYRLRAPGFQETRKMSLVE